MQITVASIEKRLVKYLRETEKEESSRKFNLGLRQARFHILLEEFSMVQQRDNISLNIKSTGLTWNRVSDHWASWGCVITVFFGEEPALALQQRQSLNKRALPWGPHLLRARLSARDRKRDVQCCWSRPFQVEKPAWQWVSLLHACYHHQPSALSYSGVQGV